MCCRASLTACGVFVRVAGNINTKNRLHKKGLRRLGKKKLDRYLPFLDGKNRQLKKRPNTGFMGAKCCEKMKVCKLLSQLFSCTLSMGTNSCSKLLLLTIIACWEAKRLQTFTATTVARKVERRNFSQSRQPCAPSHARRPSPATHRPEIPATDERPSQITKRQDGLHVMGQPCRLRMPRESASTIYATDGVTEVFFASIESVKHRMWHHQLGFRTVVGRSGRFRGVV